MSRFARVHATSIHRGDIFAVQMDFCELLVGTTYAPMHRSDFRLPPGAYLTDCDARRTERRPRRRPSAASSRHRAARFRIRRRAAPSCSSDTTDKATKDSTDGVQRLQSDAVDDGRRSSLYVRSSCADTSRRIEAELLELRATVQTSRTDRLPFSRHRITASVVIAG